MYYSFVPALKIEKGYLILHLLSSTAFGTVMFAWKMYTCCSIRLCAVDVELKFKNIKKQFSFFIDFPESLIQITQNGKPLPNPAPNDTIKWNNLAFHNENYQRLFRNGENFMKSFFDLVKSQEGASETTFRELKALISLKG